MTKREFDELMELKPSKFYIWLGKSFTKHQMSRKQWKWFTKEYEKHQQVQDTLSQDILDIFG
jgi:hypothetical protein